MRSLSYIKNEMFIECSEEEAVRFSEQYKKNWMYSHILGKALADSCAEILKNHKDELFCYLVEQDYLYWIKREPSRAEEQKRKMDVNLTKAAGELLQESVWSHRQVSLNLITSSMMYLFKECVADLIGILTLKIQMDDYLYAVQQAVVGQGQEKRMVSGIDFLRSTMVVFCMAYPLKQGADNTNVFKWDFKEFDKSKRKESDIVAQLKGKIAKYIDKYLSGKNNTKAAAHRTSKNRNGELYLFWNTEVLVELQKYLLNCRDTLNSFYNDKPSERMSEFYQLFQEQEAEKMVLGIQKYIVDYYEKIHKEIMQYAKEEYKDGNGEKHGRKHWDKIV